MPHVSHRSLPEAVHRKIIDDLFSYLRGKKQRSGSQLLSEFFTDTEHVMFAKRLAIIFMLHEGYSLYAIEQKLGVSPSTVARYARTVDAGAFRELRAYFDDRERRERFWNDLETLSRAGLPPIGGRRKKDVL